MGDEGFMDNGFMGTINLGNPPVDLLRNLGEGGLAPQSRPRSVCHGRIQAPAAALDKGKDKGKEKGTIRQMRRQMSRSRGRVVISRQQIDRSRGLSPSVDQCRCLGVH